MSARVWTNWSKDLETQEWTEVARVLGREDAVDTAHQVAKAGSIPVALRDVRDFPDLAMVVEEDVPDFPLWAVMVPDWAEDVATEYLRASGECPGSWEPWNREGRTGCPVCRHKSFPDERGRVPSHRPNHGAIYR